MKERMLTEVRRLGHHPVDLSGPAPVPGDDYPDYARSVARAVQDREADRGILVCGSGAGVCVAANKFRGIRAATCHDSFSAHQCVEDDDVNVICLGARVLASELAIEIVRIYLNARFSGAERHCRRLSKIESFEQELCK